MNLNIKSKCNSLGGLNTFKFYLQENMIIDFPYPIDGVIADHDDIGTEPWLNIEDYTNASYKETAIGFNAYKVYFSIFIPGTSADISHTLQLINGKKIVADIMDNNGIRRLVGRKNNALDVIIDFDILDAVTSTSGHSLTFSGILNEKAPIYNLL